MFDDLRRAFREAVDNFNRELNREDVPENVDRLLKGMIDEVTESKARLADLEGQLDRTGKLLEVETAEVATCRRREKMALEIGDADTAAVAVQYAEKHEERVSVLTRKLQVIGEEASLLRGEIDQMMKQLKEARTRRDGLTAEVGRAGARDTIGGSQDLFDEFDRFESGIDDQEAEAEAYQEMSREPSEHSIDFNESPRRPAVDFDARLEELKRRMKDS